jgi:cell division protein FtsZ
MFKQGIKGVDFIVCNTDSQATESSSVPNKKPVGSAFDRRTLVLEQTRCGDNNESISEIENSWIAILNGLITAGMVAGGTVLHQLSHNWPKKEIFCCAGIDIAFLV